MRVCVFLLVSKLIKQTESPNFQNLFTSVKNVTFSFAVSAFPELINNLKWLVSWGYITTEETEIRFGKEKIEASFKSKCYRRSHLEFFDFGDAGSK